MNFLLQRPSLGPQPETSQGRWRGKRGFRGLKGRSLMFCSLAGECGVGVSLISIRDWLLSATFISECFILACQLLSGCPELSSRLSSHSRLQIWHQKRGSNKNKKHHKYFINYGSFISALNSCRNKNIAMQSGRYLINLCFWHPRVFPWAAETSMVPPWSKNCSHWCVKSS